MLICTTLKLENVAVKLKFITKVNLHPYGYVAYFPDINKCSVNMFLVRKFRT